MANNRLSHNTADLIRTPGSSQHYITINTAKTAAIAKNQLIGAASKILSSVTQLKRTKTYQDVAKLKTYLVKELETFQFSAAHLNLDQDSITISRYALSACLDEIIEKSPWGINWHKHKLLQDSKKQPSADERFFIILSKICLQPEKFIDTIELMYVCLNLGFEGKFLDAPLEKYRLQQITEYTYQVIRKQRPEFERKLSAPLPNMAIKAKKNPGRLPSLPAVLVFTVLLVTGIYGGLNYLTYLLTTQAAKQLTTPYNTAQPNENQNE